MGSRYAAVVVGTVVLACAFLFAAVEPRTAGATTTVRTCGGGSIALKAREARILMLHNEARTGRGLNPLCVDLRLTRAARAHSREMIEKEYFSHSSHNGEGTRSRLGRFGYDCGACGENIAGGYGTPGTADSVFERWMGSTRHKANILDDRFRHVGVGTYTGDYKGIERYVMYTVDFGGLRQTP